MSKPDNALGTLAKELLNISEEQLAKLEKGKKEGIIELAPVALPEHPRGDNNHMGWPVGTMSGDTLVVIHRRMPGHDARGSGPADADSTFSMAIRSVDQGRTWSEPYDLRQVMKPENRDRGGIIPLSHRHAWGPLNHSRQGYKLHLNAIGTAQDGAVIALCNYGVFRSDDQGQSWKHFAEPFREDTTEGDIVYLGPRVVDHPEAGLFAFGNTVGYRPREEVFPNPVDAPADYHHKLVMLNSRDGGGSWQKIVHEFPEWAVQFEPAALLHDGELFIIGRDQRTTCDHLQMRLRKPGAPVELKRTNMRDPKKIDTLDIDYNPVTQRFEVARAARDKLRVDLWSIDPAQWDSAEWRFEGTLFSRLGVYWGLLRGQPLSVQQAGGNVDGFHPAGAIIDARRGVQHIFVYIGHSNGPAGLSHNPHPGHSEAAGVFKRVGS